MPGCTALNCLNSAAKGVRMHAFPKNEERRRLWARHTGRNFRSFPNELPTTDMKLCAAHFTEDQYEDDARFGTKLKDDAVPTIFDNIRAEFDIEEGNQAEFEQEPVEDDAIAEENFDDFEMLSEEEEEDFEDLEMLSEEENMEDDTDETPRNDLGNNSPDCDNPNADPQFLLLSQLLQDAQEENKRLKNRIKTLTAEKKKLMRQLQREKSANGVFATNLSTFLREDQLQRLKCAGTANPFPYSEETIKEALQIRLMVKVPAYKYLLEKGWPFPSYRTLCRRIEHFEFPPGLDNDIIPYLGLKLSREEEASRECYLAFDEMEMKTKIEFDPSLKKYLGFISPEIARDEEEQKTPASKVLTFVVRGLSLHWKQTVAYLFSGSSTSPEKLWECISSLIIKLHHEGLKVRGIASDMGPSNTGMWREVGVHATEGSVRTFCEHPATPEEILYVSADLPHIAKNFWAALTTQDFVLPPEVVQAHPDWEGNNRVSIDHVRKLVNHQERMFDRGFVLTHKLNPSHVSPNNLEKMSVHKALTVFSKRTAEALRFCSMEPTIRNMGAEVLVTAWFLETFREWFDIMNDRKHGIDNGLIGNAKISTLENFILLTKRLTFSTPGWKPCQTGAIVSTTTVLQLHEDLVQNGRFRYLLPGRLTTDSVENLFSQLRASGDAHPGPVQVRRALRLVNVSQFLHVPKSSNYEEDECGEYFIDLLRSRRPPERPVGHISEEDMQDPDLLSIIQENGVYHIAGWVVSKVEKNCETCIEFLSSEQPLEGCPSQWTVLLSRGGLIHPSLAVYNLIRDCEEIFNTIKDNILHRTNVTELVAATLYERLADPVKEAMLNCCHPMLDKCIRQYLHLRLFVLADDRTRRLRRQVAHAGRTAFMRTAADAYGRRRY